MRPLAFFHVMESSGNSPGAVLTLVLQPLGLCDAGEEDLRVRGLGHARVLQRHVHAGPG